MSSRNKDATKRSSKVSEHLSNRNTENEKKKVKEKAKIDESSLEKMSRELTVSTRRKSTNLNNLKRTDVATNQDSKSIRKSSKSEASTPKLRSTVDNAKLSNAAAITNTAKRTSTVNETSTPKITNTAKVSSTTKDPATAKVTSKINSSHENHATKSTIIKNNANPSRNTTVKLKKKTSMDSPSSRVTRTLYFPSKQMISNVVRAEKLNELEMNSLPRTLSNKTSKPYRKEYDSSSDTSLSIERPRTATLRKGSIVNMNIAGPEAPILKQKASKVEYETETEIDDYTYEDDFESYESDFEEYNSSTKSSISEDFTETDTTHISTNLTSRDHKNISGHDIDEDKKLDSGNFELPEYKHRQMLDNIRESIEQENVALALKSESRSNMASLSDEGFEDGKSMQGVPFINFVEAQKKNQKRRSIEKKRKRGQELLSMIKLDSQGFTIIDFPPIPYNTFIKMYGTQNTVQIGTQTGGDSVTEDTQTEVIETYSKWTQCPVTISKIDEMREDYMETYMREFTGVGSDYKSVPKLSTALDSEINNKLEKFLLSTSKVVITLLEEKNQYSLGNINSLSNVPFSNGYVDFNTNTPVLRGRPVFYISFSLVNDSFLTIHACQNYNEEEKSVVARRTIVCLWNIYNPEQPDKMFTAYGNIKCCCFGFNDSFVIGGSNTGTIVVWSVYDPISHKQILEYEDQAFNLPLPSYETEVNFGHMCNIVSVEYLSGLGDIIFDGSGEKTSDQICTLDEEGTLIIWGVLTKPKTNCMNISLVQNSITLLRSFHPELTSLNCTGMTINALNSNHLLISTNYGYIVQCLSSGTKPNPPKYSPAMKSTVNCLTSCPFSSNYFLAGHEDGSIFLYSTAIDRSLKTLNNKASDIEECKIELLEWSYNKPFIFYSKDNNNCIHIWDLESSDIFPMYTIPFADQINCMKLSPSVTTNDKNSKRSYMVIVTENGLIHLHLLNSEHGPQTLGTYQEDIKKFLNYVNRL